MSEKLYHTHLKAATFVFKMFVIVFEVCNALLGLWHVHHFSEYQR